MARHPSSDTYGGFVRDMVWARTVSVRDHVYFSHRRAKGKYEDKIPERELPLGSVWDKSAKVQFGAPKRKERNE